MIAYIIKSSLSLILMFGLYWIFLRKEKLFRFNRFFLIFAILFSLIVPVISVPVNIQNSVTERNLITILNNTIPPAITTQVPIQYPVNENTIQHIIQNKVPKKVIFPAISFTLILIILYFLGVVLLLFRFLRNILFIIRQVRLSDNILYSGEKLVLVDYQINPYCFMNTIFVSKQDYLDNRIERELLNHELQHIKQAHTIDVILIELVQVFYWFNPILILFNEAVKVNHEYLADNAVLSSSLNVKSYADILLNFISCRRNIPLTSGFNQSLTRKRLIMMTKPKSGKLRSGIKISALVSLVIIFFFTLSIVPSNSQITKPSEQQQQKQVVPTGEGVSQELLNEYQKNNEEKIPMGQTLQIKQEIVNNGNSDKVHEDIIASENNFESIADFSGKWKFNNGKSSLTVGEKTNFSIIMTIVQKNDSIIILRNTDFPDRAQLNNKASYKLDGSGIIEKTGEKTQIVSARWLDEKKSFAITTTLTYPKEGKTTEAKRVETYSLTEGGKTLTVYYHDNVPGTSFTSGNGEDKFYMVYDKTESEIPLAATNRSYPPMAVFAGKSVGSVPKNIIRNTYVLEVKVADPDLDLKYEITSFTFLYSMNNTDTELKAESNKLTNDMKSYLADMKRGQTAIFKDIKAMGPNGEKIDLSPIIITLE